MNNMDGWHSLSLGDGMMADMSLDEIRETFARLFPDGEAPSDAAVFTRHESEGRLHCEVIAYFPPAAADVAKALDAEPCPKPVRAGLGLLVGDERVWSNLFGETA